jgi:hypothetical protein
MKKKNLATLDKDELIAELDKFRVDEQPNKRFDLTKVLSNIRYFIDLLLMFLKFIGRG